MGVIVVTGAALTCSFGTIPANLNVTSQKTVIVDGKPAATIQDTMPNVNITGFGMCSSMANPVVAAATATFGVLTPQPCVPAVTGSWIPAQVSCMAEGKPCLTHDAKAVCSYGGAITVTNPGQTNVMT